MLKNERFYIVLFIFCSSILGGIDIYEDILEGTTLHHLIVEITIMLISISAITYLIIRMFSEREKLKILAQEKLILIEIAEQHKQKSRLYVEGLSFKIDEEFERWGLTNSEREVCLFILKGLDNKEIVSLRGSSETTVRHQTSSIYRKSELKNKQELLAYFIEDFLNPEPLYENAK